MYTIPLIGEYLGSFLLMLSYTTGSPIVIGFTTMFLIYILENISGSYVNPAVSVAMYVKGSLSALELFMYSLVQCAGTISAWYAYKAFI
jgi:glycerol uptake facilitator-like aquaporin